jgi:hypothetical protein
MRFLIACTLQNASDNINGVAFKPREGGEGVISTEAVEANVAATFKGIEGYQLLSEDGEDAGGGDKDEKARIIAELTEMEVQFDKRQGVDKLRGVLEQAKAAKAAGTGAGS